MTNINIGGRLHSSATGNTVAGANEIMDDNLGKKQDVVNQQLQQDINSEKNRAESVETYMQNNFLNLVAVVPVQATPQNQLADKEFVNSSIATNTSNFRGTFNSKQELDNTTGATVNDYAFVVTTDSQGNKTYQRYKFTQDDGWVFEYELNNSSFTSAQWAAINSGITAALVSKLRNLPEASDLATQMNNIIQMVRDEQARAQAAEQENTQAIIEERTRAVTAEQANAGAIANIRQEIEEEGGLSPLLMDSLTYDELATKIRRNLLMPGRKYRINDFCTYVNQEGCAMAGKPFDVVVTAIAENKLSEHATAMPHPGDESKFARGHMEAWKLLYTVDRERFGWGMGRVVMIIKATGQTFYDPDAPIRDNYLLAPWGKYVGFMPELELNRLQVIDDGLQLVSDGTGGFDLYDNHEGTSTHLTSEEVLVIKPRGCIFGMEDEWGNRCGYDFKNVKFDIHPLQLPAEMTGDEDIDEYISTFDPHVCTTQAQFAIRFGDMPTVIPVDSSVHTYKYTFNFDDSDGQHSQQRDATLAEGVNTPSGNVVSQTATRLTSGMPLQTLPMVVFDMKDPLEHITRNLVDASSQIVVRGKAVGNEILNTSFATTASMVGCRIIDASELMSVYDIQDVSIMRSAETLFSDANDYLYDDNFNDYVDSL